MLIEDHFPIAYVPHKQFVPYLERFMQNLKRVVTSLKEWLIRYTSVLYLEASKLITESRRLRSCSNSTKS